MSPLSIVLSCIEISRIILDLVFVKMTWGMISFGRSMATKVFVI